MNRLLLRSDKGEYFPGETVCGAVYLNIETPTEARGVQLSFIGREAVTCDCDVDGYKTNLRATNDYVDYSDVDLFTQRDPFALGSYCFPFRLQLPFVIPGSFRASSNDAGNTWSASVSFTLKARVVGTDSMVAEQAIVVNGTEERALKENHITMAKDISVGSSGFFGSKIHVTVKPLANFVRTGESARIRMIVTNQIKASTCFFILRLVRALTLTLPYKPRKAMEGAGDHAEDHASTTTETQEKVVQVEGGRIVVREMKGDLSQHSKLKLSRGGGLDNIMIPLRDMNGKEIIPSVNGKYIQCEYSIEVSIQLGDKVETVTCPISGILPEQNAQWLSWSTPEWTRTSELLLSPSPSPVSPPQQLLSSEAFGRLPRFHVL